MAGGSPGRRRSPRTSIVGALALIVMGTASVVGSGTVSQASAPADVAPQSVTQAILGAWTPLGTTAVSSGQFDWLKPGLNNAVYALAEYNGYLYAGGIFNGPGFDLDPLANCSDVASVPTTPLRCIARQPLGSPTSPWEPVGGGLNNTVDAMVVMGDKLYVGGMFDNVHGQGDKKCTVSGPDLNCLASWNGSSWSPLPGGGVMRASETASTLYEEIAISMFPSTAEIVGGSFAAPSGGRLARLEVRLGAANQVSNPTNVTAAIYAADVNGRPTGSPLVTQAMNVTAVPVGAGASTNPTSPNWGTATVDFTGGPVLTSGSRYAFVLSTTDSVSNAFLMATTPTTVSGISRLTGPADDPQISAKSPPVFAAYFEPPSSGPFVSTLTATPAVVELPSTAATVGGSFVATSSGPLVRLEVQLSVKSQTSNPTNVTAAIYAAGVDGTPTGSPLVTQAMDFTEVPVGPDSAPFPLAPYWGRGSVNFVNPLNITSGSRYAFVLTSTDSASNALQMATTPQTITGFSLLTLPASTWQSDPSTPPAFAAYLPTSEAKVQNLAALGGSTLIASGGFSWAGGEAQELGGLVEWSAAGGSFTAPGVGGSFSNLVQSLLTDGTGNVYVGGDFEGGYNPPDVTQGVLNGLGVARGPFATATSWSPMSSGLKNGPSQPGRVDALALLNGTVYAGGYFDRNGSGTGSFKNLVSWNGSTWEPVGPGLSSDTSGIPKSVRAMATDEERGLLYVGGTFAADGSVAGSANPCTPGGPLRCVTVWDSGIEQFIPFQWGTGTNDNGLTGEVKAFVVKGPDVYVGGLFNTNAQGLVPGGAFPYQWNLKNVGKWTWNAPTGAVSTAASSNGSFTITGTGFIGVPRTGGVKLGSTPVSYTRSSATSITATVPCDLASGTYAITVDGVGGWGNVGTVAVTQRPCPAPAAPTATPTSTTTPAATPTPTPAPTATGPTVEQLQAAGEVRPSRVPALSKGVPPGEAIVIVNGQPQKNNLTVWQQGMTVRTGPITMAVRSQSTSGTNLAPEDGTLAVTQAAAQTRERRVSPPGIQLTTSGNAPSTPVRVYLVPQPKTGPRGARTLDLGYLMTDAQGRLQGKVSVRARRAGSYIVQINGTGADGLVRSINLPATVRR